MQNVGQFGPGAASAHPPSQFVPSEPSPNGGSTTTSSLRQFRKKDVDKSHIEQQSPKQMSESHVARVAPHNHYPPASSDVYRYPAPQFSGYSPQVKYSDLAETSQPNPISTSVIQKPKPKDYMEMCNVQQQHLNSHQQYSPDNGQYLHKDPVQGYPAGFKPESHFFPKDQHQYQQLPHHPGPKFNTIMTQNMRKYNPPPADNPFLNKLSKIHPSMARSIISDHHLQDTQPAYPSMDQRGMYSQQNHRYYSGSIPQPNPYSPSPGYTMNAPHPYSNYPSASCSYPRPTQLSSVPPRYPPMERSMSPGRRGYPEAMHMAHMNYHPMHQKMPSGPSYSPQYRGPEYAQHYQHRRMPQDCFPPACRPGQYMQGHHQIPGQEMQELTEDTVSPSDSLKKFIENWADEEPSGEISTMEANMNLREKLRDDAPAGTVYMINANDVQYFENNGIPIVTSDNGGFQLTSEYLVKNGLVDNNGVVRIIEANKDISSDSTGNQERVVNLQIMEATKPDCMMATKHLRPNEALMQKNIVSKPEEEDRRVVIHQNTILNPGNVVNDRIPQPPVDQIPSHQSVVDSISITKELVDKNCSPINLDHFDHNLGFSEPDPPETENVSLESSSKSIKISDSQTDPSDNQTFSSACEDLSQNSDDCQYKSPGNKSMPIIDFFGDASVLSSGKCNENIEEKESEDSRAHCKSMTDENSTCQAHNCNNVEHVIDENREMNQDEIKVEHEESTSEAAKDSEKCRDNSDVSNNVIVTTDIKSEPLTNEVENSETKNVEAAQPSCDKDTPENYEDNESKHEIRSLSPETEDTGIIQAPVDRRKRIFSVDDIMGINNAKKSSREVDNVCNFVAFANFIEKEVEFSSLEQMRYCKEAIRYESNLNNNSQIEAGSSEHEEVKKEINEEQESESICRCGNGLAPPEHPRPVQIQNSETQTNTCYIRDALKVDGNSILLQVAGELMKICVNFVDGRKVINVTPLSDSTAVIDYNDNYEFSARNNPALYGSMPSQSNEEIEESVSKDSASNSVDGSEIHDSEIGGRQIEANEKLQNNLSDRSRVSDVSEHNNDVSLHENIVSDVNVTEKNNNEDVFIDEANKKYGVEKDSPNNEVIRENIASTEVIPETVTDPCEVSSQEPDYSVLEAPQEIQPVKTSAALDDNESPNAHKSIIKSVNIVESLDETTHDEIDCRNEIIEEASGPHQDGPSDDPALIESHTEEAMIIQQVNLPDGNHLEVQVEDCISTPTELEEGPKHLMLIDSNGTESLKEECSENHEVSEPEEVMNAPNNKDVKNHNLTSLKEESSHDESNDDMNDDLIKPTWDDLDENVHNKEDNLAEEEATSQSADVNVAKETELFSESAIKKVEIISLSNVVDETNIKTYSECDTKDVENDSVLIDEVSEKVNNELDASSGIKSAAIETVTETTMDHMEEISFGETLDAKESEANVDHPVDFTDANLLGCHSEVYNEITPTEEDDDVAPNLEECDPKLSEVIEEPQDNLDEGTIASCHVEHVMKLEGNNADVAVDEDAECAVELLDFPLEDEVFIAEPPAHEVVVTDPLEGLGVIEERGIMSDSPEIPLEPVTTTAEIIISDPEKLTGSLTGSKISDVTVVMLDANLETIENSSTENPASKIIMENESEERETNETNNELVKKTIEPEIQILSPTSTNVEDPIGISKNIVYVGPSRKFSMDNDLSDHATSTSVVATKAAKKLYESDLQVQHDIVSSSKKEDVPKPTTKNKKSGIKRSKRLNEKVQLKNEQKEMLKLLAEKRKRREELRKKELMKREKHYRENPEKIESKMSLAKNECNPVEHDEEYVDFKELLLARKLKKLKKLQESKVKEPKESNKLRHDNIQSKQRVSSVSSSHARDKKVEKQNDCCIGCGNNTAKRFKTNKEHNKKHRDEKETKDHRKSKKEIEPSDTTKTISSDVKPLVIKPETSSATALKSDDSKSIQIVPQNMSTEPTSQKNDVSLTENIKQDKAIQFTDDGPSSTSCTAVMTVKKSMSSDHMLHSKDPRRKSKVLVNQVMVPSVSELIEENSAPVSKKKISLADYVSRKRKVTCTDDGKNKTECPDKRQKLDSSGYERTDSTDSISTYFSEEGSIASKPKTLNNVKTSFVIHSSDWEDSNSPASAPTQSKEECLMRDFSGLIKSKPKKPVIDVNELTPLENPKDRTLQEYKDKIDSQLSSLNIHIPKSKPLSSDVKSSKLSLGPYRSPESTSLVKRFLNNEKLSHSEMENIRKIISYKRSIQYQKNVKSPSKSPSGNKYQSYGSVSDKSPACSSHTESSPAPAYDGKNNSRQETGPKEMRLHFKKVNGKRKLQIISDEEDSGSVVMSNQSENNPKKNVGYSVFNRLGEDGQPKIILKRNKRSGFIKQPVVELVKLDLDDLEKVKQKYNVIVRQTM